VIVLLLCFVEIADVDVVNDVMGFLCLVRSIVSAANRCRDHDFSLHGGLIGRDIHGQTVGVIGTGKIGQVFCRIMHGFGCRVLAFDVHENVEMKGLGVEYVPLDKLLQTSDVISLHCPLMPATHHLINSASVEKMKRGVVLVNCSRGALVESGALITGLKGGRIGGFAMDVYERESALYFTDRSDQVLQDDNFLILSGLPNVLITPVRTRALMARLRMPAD
jgi:D-lactate dehydrogenase